MLFKRKKNDKKKPDFFNLGKNGTPDEFQPALSKAFAKYDVEAQKELRRGAIEAFNEGRHENFQSLLLDLHKSQWLSSIGTLDRLIKENDNPSSAINLALDKMSAQEKQKFLDDTLYKIVNDDPVSGDENLVAALLQAGANANAESHGSGGRILACATTYAHPPGVIKLLYENGATFEEALLRIRTRPYWDDKRELCIERLKAYQEAVTGEPATSETKMQQTIDLLRQQVEELTERLPPEKPPAPPANRLMLRKASGTHLKTP